MNYEEFRNYNNSRKTAGLVRHRIVSADFKQGYALFLLVVD